MGERKGREGGGEPELIEMEEGRGEVAGGIRVLVAMHPNQI